MRTNYLQNKNIQHSHCFQSQDCVACRHSKTQAQFPIKQHTSVDVGPVGGGVGIVIGIFVGFSVSNCRDIRDDTGIDVVSNLG